MVTGGGVSKACVGEYIIYTEYYVFFSRIEQDKMR